MENEIINKLIEKINANTYLKISVLDTEIAMGKNRINAKIQIAINKQKYIYYVEIIKNIIPSQVLLLQEKIQKYKNYILFAEYISNPAKEILRQKNIAYADISGNVFIKTNIFYVFVETGKTARAKQDIGNRAFNKTGLKLLYLFLKYPDYLNKSYRFLGDKAGITIDTVSKVLKELLYHNYIVKLNNKEYQFTDRTKLFSDWVTAFNKNLRPKLKQKKYSFINKTSNYKNVKLPKHTYWGGAVAAEILNNYLISDKAIIYTALPEIELMKKLKIIPDKNGEVTIVEQFWKENTNNNLVDNMLIYADLVNETNPRYLETANKIYKNYVENIL